MAEAEFTLTLKGTDAEQVGRVLRAAMEEYQAIEKEASVHLEELYRWNLGNRFIYPRGPYSSLRGTISMKYMDAALMGWH